MTDVKGIFNSIYIGYDKYYEEPLYKVLINYLTSDRLDKDEVKQILKETYALYSKYKNIKAEAEDEWKSLMGEMDEIHKRHEGVLCEELLLEIVDILAMN